MNDDNGIESRLRALGQLRKSHETDETVRALQTESLQDRRRVLFLAGAFCTHQSAHFSEGDIMVLRTAVMAKRLGFTRGVFVRYLSKAQQFEVALPAFDQQGCCHGADCLVLYERVGTDDVALIVHVPMNSMILCVEEGEEGEEGEGHDV